VELYLFCHVLHGVDRDIFILTVHNRVSQRLGRDTNLCREAILSRWLNNYMILLNTNSPYFGECTNTSIFFVHLITCNDVVTTSDWPSYYKNWHRLFTTKLPGSQRKIIISANEVIVRLEEFSCFEEFLAKHVKIYIW